MRTLVAMALCVLVLIGSSGAPLSAGEEAAAEYTYVGAKKCKVCHKKPEDGEQYGIWEKGPHAGAYETLASDEAKAEAAKLGIEDPQKAPECLKCHATAFAVMEDLANQKITLEEGVSCESCHGAGSGYKKKSTMEAISAGEIEPASVGLNIPDEATCTGCHNAEGNPFHKEFDFETFYEKIAHPIPSGEEAEEEG